MTENEFRKVAVDEGVIRRVKEAEAARLQEFAGRAAKRGDWNEVDSLLAQAQGLAAQNPWLGEIVTNLERLAAQRNDELFSKEALYAASSMSSRLRSKAELSASFDESSAPSHLQRKVRQGRIGHYEQQPPKKT